MSDPNSCYLFAFWYLKTAVKHVCRIRTELGRLYTIRELELNGPNCFIDATSDSLYNPIRKHPYLLSIRN